MRLIQHTPVFKVRTWTGYTSKCLTGWPCFGLVMKNEKHARWLPSKLRVLGTSFGGEERPCLDRSCSKLPQYPFVNYSGYSRQGFLTRSFLPSDFFYFSTVFGWGYSNPALSMKTRNILVTVSWPSVQGLNLA